MIEPTGSNELEKAVHSGVITEDDRQRIETLLELKDLESVYKILRDYFNF